MARETRKGTALGRYYTRSRWSDGKVKREYVGTGRAAEARARRAAEAEALRLYRLRLGPPDRLTAELAAACKQLTEAALAAAGYHRHGGEWRLRRADRGTAADRP